MLKRLKQRRVAAKSGTADAYEAANFPFLKLKLINFREKIFMHLKVLFLFSLISVSLQVNAQDSFSGKITDDQNEVIPYAHIYNLTTKGGTISNEDGLFRITKPAGSNDSIKISALGYEALSFLWVDGNSFIDTIITLKSSSVNIAEIQIKDESADEIIRKAKNAVAENYPQTENAMAVFFREVLKHQFDYFNYSEGIFECLTGPYPNENIAEEMKVKLIKGRKKQDLKSFENVNFVSDGGPIESFQNDIIYQAELYLDGNNYNYSLAGVDFVDGIPVYKIKLTQKKLVKKSLLDGFIFINMKDYAVLAADLKTSPVGLKHQKFVPWAVRPLIRAFGFKISKEFQAAYRINYEKVDDQYLLDRVIENMTYEVRKEGVNYNFDFSRLMIVKERNINWNSVADSLLFTADDVLKSKAGSFDDPYWDNVNMIQIEQKAAEFIKED